MGWEENIEENIVASNNNIKALQEQGMTDQDQMTKLLEAVESIKIDRNVHDSVYQLILKQGERIRRLEHESYQRRQHEKLLAEELGKP